MVKLSPMVLRIQGYAARSYNLTGMPDMMYLVGSGKSRLLIDAGEGREEDLPLLIQAMEKVGCTDISDVLITHYHPNYTEGLKRLRAHFGEDLRVWSLPWSTSVVGNLFKKEMQADSGSFMTRRVETLDDGAVITTRDSDAKLTAAVHGNVWKAEVRGKKMWIEATFAGTMKKTLVRNTSRKLLVPRVVNKVMPQPALDPEPQPAPEECAQLTSQAAPDPEPPAPEESPMASSHSPVGLLRKPEKSENQLSRDCSCQRLLLLPLLLVGLLQVAWQQATHTLYVPRTGVPAQTDIALAVETCPVKHLWYGCTRCVCSWSGPQNTAVSTQNHATEVRPIFWVQPSVAARPGVHRRRSRSKVLLRRWRWRWQFEYDNIAKAYFAQRTNITDFRWRQKELVNRGMG